MQRDWLKNGAKFKQQQREGRDTDRNYESTANTVKAGAIRKITLQQGKDVRECLKNKLLDPDVL